MKAISRRVGIAIVIGLALYGLVSLACTVWRKGNPNPLLSGCFDLKTTQP